MDYNARSRAIGVPRWRLCCISLPARGMAQGRPWDGLYVTFALWIIGPIWSPSGPWIGLLYIRLRNSRFRVVAHTTNHFSKKTLSLRAAYKEIYKGRIRVESLVYKRAGLGPNDAQGPGRRIPQGRTIWRRGRNTYIYIARNGWALAKCHVTILSRYYKCAPWRTVTSWWPIGASLKNHSAGPTSRLPRPGRRGRRPNLGAWARPD